MILLTNPSHQHQIEPRNSQSYSNASPIIHPIIAHPNTNPPYINDIAHPCHCSLSSAPNRISNQPITFERMSNRPSLPSYLDDIVQKRHKLSLQNADLLDERPDNVGIVAILEHIHTESLPRQIDRHISNSVDRRAHRTWPQELGSNAHLIVEACSYRRYRQALRSIVYREITLAHRWTGLRAWMERQSAPPHQESISCSRFRWSSVTFWWWPGSLQDRPTRRQTGGSLSNLDKRPVNADNSARSRVSSAGFVGWCYQVAFVVRPRRCRLRPGILNGENWYRDWLEGELCRICDSIERPLI